MENFPLFLDMRDRLAVVVGGEVVAARRADLLLRAGAKVRVVAPALSDDFRAVNGASGYEWRQRAPVADDFRGARLCCIADEDEALEREARAMAQAAGALVNVADKPELCDFIMPSIVDRSPLLVAISTGGASPILGRMLKSRLESSIPASYGRLATLVRGYRDRLAAALPSQTLRRRFWERVLEGPVGEMGFAGDEAGARTALEAEIDRAAEGGENAPLGEVYLVGAGPGDPDLLTFRALRLMQKADVVLYDRLANSAVMALVRREAERIYVGKRANEHEMPQEEISALLVKLAKEGKRVLRLKGGDPFMFGRGGEEIEMLAEHGVAFQVCPGVTAATGASSYAGIPLTHRDHAQACVFVTGHGKNGTVDLDWRSLAQPNQTIAIYMGLRNLEPLMQQLVASGASPDLPAAIVDNATRPNQRVIVGTLSDLAAKARAAELRGPSVVIVGTVVTLHDKLASSAARAALHAPAPKAL